MVRSKRIQRLLDEVVEKIKIEYDPERIILYGSYAYGRPNRDSDIDLFIIKETDRRRVDRFVEVSRLVGDLVDHIPVSPMVYTPEEVERRLAMGDQFVEEILARGELLYAR